MSSKFSQPAGVMKPPPICKKVPPAKKPDTPLADQMAWITLAKAEAPILGWEVKGGGFLDLRFPAVPQWFGRIGDIDGDHAELNLVYNSALATINIGWTGWRGPGLFWGRAHIFSGVDPDQAFSTGPIDLPPPPFLGFIIVGIMP